MEDIKKSPNKVNYKINGECPETCGRCCQSILPVSEYEINKINKYISRNPECFVNIINKNNDIAKTVYEDRCPFLSIDNKCIIYTHRPEICRKFTCGQQTSDFNYSDKRLINMWSEFFPEYTVYNAPDIVEMDKYFQEMKRKAKM